MRSRSFRFSTFWALCLWGLIAISLSEEFVLKRRSKEGGIFEDQSYDDPIGELTAQQRRSYAYAKQQHLESDDADLSEDESQDVQKDREMKDLFFKEIDKHRKELSVPSKQVKKEVPIQGETAEDREALRREEEKNAKQQKRTKRDKLIPLSGQIFEGDMVMSNHFRSHLLMGENAKRDALTDKMYLWEKRDETVRVPYGVDDNFNELKRERLRHAVADFNKYTCIRFVPKTEADDAHLHFMSNKSMCYSSVGKQGGKQKISIGDGCERKGTVIHEMLHSIGFIHEQSRPDRDKFVKVVWANIKPHLKHNFEKYPGYIVDNLGVKYDFDSVLHYHNSAFSNNGEDTLIDRKDPSRKFGQRIGFSKRNIEQVNRLYSCSVDPSVMDDVQYV